MIIIIKKYHNVYTYPSVDSFLISVELWMGELVRNILAIMNYKRVQLCDTIGMKGKARRDQIMN